MDGKTPYDGLQAIVWGRGISSMKLRAVLVHTNWNGRLTSQLSKLIPFEHESGLE